MRASASRPATRPRASSAGARRSSSSRRERRAGAARGRRSPRGRGARGTAARARRAAPRRGGARPGANRSARGWWRRRGARSRRGRRGPPPGRGTAAGSFMDPSITAAKRRTSSSGSAGSASSGPRRGPEPDVDLHRRVARPRVVAVAQRRLQRGEERLGGEAGQGLDRGLAHRQLSSPTATSSGAIASGRPEAPSSATARRRAGSSPRRRVSRWRSRRGSLQGLPGVVGGGASLRDLSFRGASSRRATRNPPARRRTLRSRRGRTCSG